MVGTIDEVASRGDYLLTEYQVQQHGRLVSAACRAPGMRAATFLHYGTGRARFLWRDGRSDITFAGIGSAVDLMAWGETRIPGIERQVRELFENAVTPEEADLLAAPRLFGGFAFREDFVPDFAWQGFNPAHFILPHFQLVDEGEECWLTINALVPADEDPAETLPQLQEALALCYRELCALGSEYPHTSQRPNTEHQTISYPMSAATWATMIRNAQREFAATPLDKVVLARVCEVRQQQPIDLDGALSYLQGHYPECYTFLFEPQPHHAFFGATPELLVATKDRELQTMGLAGSIQRGKTPAEDDALATDLLNSTKDRHEHALVVASLEKRLAPLAETLQIPPAPEVYRLSNIQHLYTPVTATMRTAQGVLPFVDALHPTPALGGSPRDLALAFISEEETVPRGWYAGPIGWIDQTLDGAFGVAIRSAVAQGKRAWLYAGAGIVDASEPDKEWAETGWKFRPIQAALGVEA